MIEIKSTKTQPQANDPQQRYATKGLNASSKTPAYIALFLAAVGLYLKSIFPGMSKTHEQLPDKHPEQEEPLEAMKAVAELPGQDAGQPAAQVQDPEKLGSGNQPGLLDLPRPASFTLVESPAFQFTEPKPPLEWFSPRTTSFQPAAANDNPGGGAGGGASGGGSGGGSGNAGGGGGAAPPQSGSPAGDGGTLPPDNGSDPGGGDGSGTGNTPDEPGPDDDDTNRAPRLSGPVYLMDVVGCATLAIGLSDLLAHAQDPDSDPLTVQNLTASTGTLNAVAGGWVFETDGFELGPVVISYEVSDGQFAVEQFAYFSIVKAPPIIGTEGADMLVGTLCADEIDGAGGDDVIDAGAGNDTVKGGSGDDNIVAGLGHDVVFGGAGHDVVFAGAGNDHVSGGAGNDRLFGEAGDDVLFGDEGDDQVSGGEGNDRLFGGAGNDTADGGEGNDTIDGGTGADALFGDAGDDRIDGGEGNDRIDGGDGNDIVLDGAGEDEVLGGAGDDYVVAALDGSNDTYDGGDGTDVLDYSAASEALTINLVAGTASGAEIGDDCVLAFEVINSGSGDDHVIIGVAGSIITGGDGNDIFEFDAPQDTPASSAILFQITDFQSGDRLRISKQDLFAEVFDKLENQFEKIYGEGIDGDEVRLRYSSDRTEEMGRKIVEADLDRDGVWETTIEADGQLVIVTVEGV